MRKHQGESWSPDSFMFREFDIHADIFRLKSRNDYFMLSSGTNQFPMPALWKETIKKEIDYDFLYRWYTCSQGFQSATAAIKVYEDFISTHGEHKPKTGRAVCMTVGGSGAASIVFDYLQYRFGMCRIILVGMNYSLYERLAKKHGFPVEEFCSAQAGRSTPTIEDFKQFQFLDEKTVFVFSNPNNPTGECYQFAEFNEITSLIHKSGGYIILDQVCDLPITARDYSFLEWAFTQNECWSECVVINSFSKTDAVAGFRLGYLYGNRELIEAAGEIQAGTIMNPQTIPVVPVVLTCMFRYIFLNERFNLSSHSRDYISKYFRRLFFYTSSILPTTMRNYMDDVFLNYEYYYAQYIAEQLKNEKIIQSNYNFTLERLSQFLASVTLFSGGFNFCAWFRDTFRLNEEDFVRLLLHQTGIAVLTESAFTLRPCTNNRYAIRFSLACEEKAYQEAILRLQHFLSDQEIFL